METIPRINTQRGEALLNFNKETESLIKELDNVANGFKKPEIFTEQEDADLIRPLSPYFTLEQIATALYLISELEISDEALTSVCIMLEEAMRQLETSTESNEETKLVLKKVYKLVESYPKEFKFLQSEFTLAN